MLTPCLLPAVFVAATLVEVDRSHSDAESQQPSRALEALARIAEEVVRSVEQTAGSLAADQVGQPERRRTRNLMPLRLALVLT